MVKRVEENKEALHQCEVCCLHYRDPELAKKCEAWCREHKSCNLDIIQHAIENRRGI